MTTEAEVRIESRLYERDLPGGGFVAIELTREVEGDREIPRTRVCVERRTDADRRSGHQPPVIAYIEGDGATPAVAELYSIATDNVAIARALLDLQRRARLE